MSIGAIRQDALGAEECAPRLSLADALSAATVPGTRRTRDRAIARIDAGLAGKILTSSQGAQDASADNQNSEKPSHVENPQNGPALGVECKAPTGIEV